MWLQTGGQIPSSRGAPSTLAQRGARLTSASRQPPREPEWSTASLLGAPSPTEPPRCCPVESPPAQLLPAHLLAQPLPARNRTRVKAGDLTHQPALTEGLPSSDHWEGRDSRQAELAGTHQVHSHACLSLPSLVQASAQGFSPHEETGAQRGEVSPTRPSAQPGAGRGDGFVQATHPAPGSTPEPHGPPTRAPHT